MDDKFYVVLSIGTALILVVFVLVCLELAPHWFGYLYCGVSLPSH